MIDVPRAKPGKAVRTGAALVDLDPLLNQAREAAERRPPGGVTAIVQFVVGEQGWVVDTRPGTLAHNVIRSARTEHADVVVTLDEAATFVALLDGSLPPLRAWAEKKIRVTGDQSKLRALEWLSHASRGKSRRSLGASVQVRGANAPSGYGVYEVVVSEEAACWRVYRRWRELKQLASELAAEYGEATPYNLTELPSLRAHSMRSSGSAPVLRTRQRQMHKYLSTVLDLLPTSPRTGTGPAALLRFLGGEHFGETVSKKTKSGSTGGDALDFPRTASRDADWSDANSSAAPGNPPRGTSISELRILARLEEQSAEIGWLRTLLYRGQLVTSLGLCVAGLIAAAIFAMPQLLDGWVLTLPTSPVPAWAAALVLGSLGLGGLTFAWLALCRPLQLRLLRRAARVTHLFVSVLIRYKITRIRTRRRATDLSDADLWERTHELVGEMVHRDLLALGGLWVKIGQYVASRADVIPAPIVTALSEMLDANPPRPLAQVVHMLMEELGPEGAARLATIDPVPLSTASIAQVRWKATWHACRLVVLRGTPTGW